ncbi:MAG: RNA methyltransferase [Spirochaetaceae bacterium]|jgi:tRNA (guanosine-2'-O-)-methyltransferase|nr:RNA methyltransferase [Spirochaetaceae bacterium]
MDEELIKYLSTFISKERYQRMVDVLSRRTDYLTVVLEDLHYSQNASSVIRHCDAFGVQNIHIIENRNKFKLKNHAVRGTVKWISLNFYNEKKQNSLDTINSLKSKGYRIIATSPRPGGSTPATLKLESGKAALFFGNERDGLSDEILKNADEFIQIPMEGFVESLNISASCSIILQQLGDRLRNSEINWQFDEKTKNQILINWIKNSINKSDQIMKVFNSPH